MEDKLIIGRIEKINFPILGFKNVEAKIDTGAYTSSLNCVKIKKKKKKIFVKILILNKIKKFIFRNYKKVIVKSSNGQSEKRFLIKTPIKIVKIRIKT